MPTTQNDIREWLDRAEPNHTHMMVVCDQFDYEDFPVFITATETEARRRVSEYNGRDMTRVMEIYDLKSDLEDQLSGGIAFNY